MKSRPKTLPDHLDSADLENIRRESEGKICPLHDIQMVPDLTPTTGSSDGRAGPAMQAFRRSPTQSARPTAALAKPTNMNGKPLPAVTPTIAEKVLPVGVCDLCGEAFPPGTSLYTSKGLPRLYCGPDCKNTANSRAGAPIRAETLRQRVRRGEWVNPRDLMTPEQISEMQSRASRKGRLREVAEGRWRNPALDDAAREKLSRPRRHGDNPLLHSALEKLRSGSMADLTPDERQAHRDYRRQLNHARADESRAYHRRRYRERMQTATGQARERARWELERERMAQRSPNQRLIDARKAAGLSQQALAEKVGVAQVAVSKWERFGAIPREANVRQRVQEILGNVWE